VKRHFVMMVAVAAFCPVLLTVAGAAAAGTGAADGARAASSGTWGTAEEVPGTAALNKGGEAGINEVSCGAAGSCSVGGWYADRSDAEQAFVAGETNGTWGAAREVPGTAALNVGGGAQVYSVSCASAGNCSAAGQYTDRSDGSQAFVAGETNGTWRTAREVPGTAALNKGGSAAIYSLSCASAGDCSAGGWYAESSGARQALVVTETNGTWGTAEEVPGTAALNKHGDAMVNRVSCASAGDCSAGGYYAQTSEGARSQAFVVTETNGTWGTAEEVPGTAALNKGGEAQVYSVSCASAGNCSAAGQYTDGSGRYQAFVAGETNGTWRTAREVPGTAALNTHGDAQLSSVSCASAGNCSAVGSYLDASGSEVFVAGETNGTWGTAEEVPGTAALNKDGFAAFTEVSCAAAGDCSAGGYYADSSGQTQLFVVGETNGAWGKAEEVPGTAALGGNPLEPGLAVSCASAGNCSAGGQYEDHSSHYQAFVVSEK
jgi:uncharacterized protein CbrC (UPF0167 family)